MNKILILFCETSASEKLFSFIGQIFNIIIIIIPVLIIIIGFIDLIKILISQKFDQIKQNRNMIIKRLLIGIIIFFVTIIVNYIIGLLKIDVPNQCMNCFLNPNDCKVEQPIPVKPLELINSECQDSANKDLCCKEKNGPNDTDGIWIWNDNYGCKNTMLTNID